MSSSELGRRAVLGAGLLVLSACGYTPVYGPDGPARALQGAILVAAPETREGYVLVRRLESRLGQPEAPRYALDYRIVTDADAVGVTQEQVTTRFNLLGEVDFVLRDIDTDMPVLTGEVTNFTGYAATGSTVATLTATEDATTRLMRALADQIVTRLLADAERLQP